MNLFKILSFAKPTSIPYPEAIENLKSILEKPIAIASPELTSLLQVIYPRIDISDQISTITLNKGLRIEKFKNGIGLSDPNEDGYFFNSSSRIVTLIVAGYKCLKIEGLYFGENGIEGRNGLIEYEHETVKGSFMKGKLETGLLSHKLKKGLRDSITYKSGEIIDTVVPMEILVPNLINDENPGVERLYSGLFKFSGITVIKESLHTTETTHLQMLNGILSSNVYCASNIQDVSSLIEKQKDKPILILTGPKTHRICLVVYKFTLAFINRGVGSKKSLGSNEQYVSSITHLKKVDPKKLSTLFKFLQELSNLDFNEGMPKFESHLSTYEKSDSYLNKVSHKEQLIGNCEILSCRTAAEVILYYLIGEDNPKKSHEEIWHDTHTLYKQSFGSKATLKVMLGRYFKERIQNDKKYSPKDDPLFKTSSTKKTQKLQNEICLIWEAPMIANIQSEFPGCDVYVSEIGRSIKVVFPNKGELLVDAF